MTDDESTGSVTADTTVVVGMLKFAGTKAFGTAVKVTRTVFESIQAAEATEKDGVVYVNTPDMRPQLSSARSLRYAKFPPSSSRCNRR